MKNNKKILYLIGLVGVVVLAGIFLIGMKPQKVLAVGSSYDIEPAGIWSSWDLHLRLVGQGTPRAQFDYSNSGLNDDMFWMMDNFRTDWGAGAQRVTDRTGAFPIDGYTVDANVNYIYGDLGEKFPGTGIHLCWARDLFNHDQSYWQYGMIPMYWSGNRWGTSENRATFVNADCGNWQGAVQWYGNLRGEIHGWHNATWAWSRNTSSNDSSYDMMAYGGSTGARGWGDGQGNAPYIDAKEGKPTNFVVRMQNIGSLNWDTESQLRVLKTTGEGSSPSMFGNETLGNGSGTAPRGTKNIAFNRILTAQQGVNYGQNTRNMVMAQTNGYANDGAFGEIGKINVNLIKNTCPAVEMISPANGFVFDKPGPTVNLVSKATDVDVGDPLTLTFNLKRVDLTPDRDYGNKTVIGVVAGQEYMVSYGQDTPEGFLPAGDYTWTVTANDGNCDSTSPERTFTRTNPQFNAPPNPPLPLSPGVDANDQGFIPEYSAKNELRLKAKYLADLENDPAKMEFDLWSGRLDNFTGKYVPNQNLTATPVRYTPADFPTTMRGGDETPATLIPGSYDVGYYMWRARLLETTGNLTPNIDQYSPWSSYFIFRKTTPPAEAPATILITPADGDLVPGPDAMLTAKPADPNAPPQQCKTTINLKDADLNPIQSEQSGSLPGNGSVAFNLDTPELTPDTTYNWDGQSLNTAAGNGSNTDDWDFRTAKKPIVHQTAPVNGSTLDTVDAELVGWAENDQGSNGNWDVRLRFTLMDNNNTILGQKDTGVIGSCSDGSKTGSVIFPGLTRDATYKWYVVAVSMPPGNPGNGFISDPSYIWTFNTPPNNRKPIISLVSPPNGSTLEQGKNSVDLVANATDPDDNNITYTFYIQEIGNKNYGPIPAGQNAEVTFNNLMPNTTYHWYAVATDDGLPSLSDTSPTWTFTTTSFPISIDNKYFPFVTIKMGFVGNRTDQTGPVMEITNTVTLEELMQY